MKGPGIVGVLDQNQWENGGNYTKRAILQVMKEALDEESSRFTF